MPGATTFRLLREEDVPALHDLMETSFGDLDRRLGTKYAGAGPRPHQSRIRFGRLLASDPDGCWVAEREGALIGCACGILREGVWGLSMFIVSPAAQSAGVGRELLRRAWSYGEGSRGQIILASRDSRAMAAYSRLGLTLHPCVLAAGPVRAASPPPDVRPGTAEDLALTEAVDRAVRGAAHGEDILAMVEGGATLLVAPERGYVVVLGGTVRLLAAFDEPAAADVLRAALAHAAADRADGHVEWISSRQSWAVPVCLDAGLELRTTCGPVFTGGDVGPFRPYLPSGAYL